MRIGIGLPTAVPGRSGSDLVAWARAAEDAGFSALGAIDRLVYDSYDPLVALGAVAAVTERIELVTDIAIGPIRSSAVLAKEAATLDHLSGGRLTLGVGIGARADDYTPCGMLTSGRGKRFDAQLDDLRRVWAGEPRGTAGRIGPAPLGVDGRPALLVGGDPRHAAERVARYGDGWTMAVGAPADLAAGRAVIERAWAERGRLGGPRITALAYFSLGADAQVHADGDLKHYYAWLGADVADAIAATALTSPEAVCRAVNGFAAAGADQLLLMPCQAGVEQVALLADAVSAVRTEAVLA